MNQSKYVPRFTYKFSDNVSINYETQGTGDKKIIFLHGLGASLNSWNDIRNLFPQNEFELIFIDMKGFGFSTKPRDGKYSIKDQAEVIYKFIEDLKSERIFLIGHSLGGGAALLTYTMGLISGKDLKIDKLILINCLAYPEDLPVWAQLGRVRLFMRILNMLPPKIRVLGVLKYLFYDSGKIRENHVDRYAFFQNQIRYSVTETVYQILTYNVNGQAQKYRQIEIPVLIIWGKNDPAISIEHGIKLHRELPISDFEVIDNCGHIPHEELPGQTYALIKKFLEI